MMCTSSAFTASQCPPLINRGNVSRTFEFSVEFLPSKAKLVDGSVRYIERDTIMKWEVEFEEIYPHEIQSMEERVVRNVVEKIGESIFWGPEQEVALLRLDNCKGEYVRTKNGAEMVDEIDRQDGWASKQTTFHAELIDLKSDSKVGYVPSKLASQMVDDDWASQRQITPTYLVDDQDEEEKGESSLPNDANIDAWEYVHGHLIKYDADDVDDAHNDELPNYKLFSRRKRGGQPLVVEDCWAIKKARIDGCRKKRSFGKAVQDEPNLDDVVVQDEPDLDDVVVQDETNLDDVVVQNEPNLDDVGGAK
ncbi:hypothetical protein D1007_53238 [Hordeum vulgare]|nr:hypothetical protein D1007_53238 [Hordeum vulgare]